MPRNFTDYLGKDMPKKAKKVDYVEELAKQQESQEFAGEEFNQEDVLVAKPVDATVTNFPPPAAVPPQPIATPPTVVQTNQDVSDNILTSVVLMLNQILEELSVINAKIDQKIASMESTQAIAPKPAKRKIILNKDANGKIISADVIDTPDGE